MGPKKWTTRLSLKNGSGWAWESEVEPEYDNFTAGITSLYIENVVHIIVQTADIAVLISEFG